MTWLRLALCTLALWTLSAYFFSEIIKALRQGNLRTIQNRRKIVVVREKEPGFFFYTLGLWLLFGGGAACTWIVVVKKILTEN